MHGHASQLYSHHLKKVVPGYFQPGALALASRSPAIPRPRMTQRRGRLGAGVDRAPLSHEAQKRPLHTYTHRCSCSGQLPPPAPARPAQTPSARAVGPVHAVHAAHAIGASDHWPLAAASHRVHRASAALPLHALRAADFIVPSSPRGVASDVKHVPGAVEASLRAGARSSGSRRNSPAAGESIRRSAAFHGHRRAQSEAFASV